MCQNLSTRYYVSVTRASFVQHRPETVLKKFSLLIFHDFFAEVAPNTSMQFLHQHFRVIYVNRQNIFVFLQVLLQPWKGIANSVSVSSASSILMKGCIYCNAIRILPGHYNRDFDLGFFFLFLFEELTCVLCCCMLSCNIVTYSIRTSRFLCSAMRKIKEAESVQLLRHLTLWRCSCVDNVWWCPRKTPAKA